MSSPLFIFFPPRLFCSPFFLGSEVLLWKVIVALFTEAFPSLPSPTFCRYGPSAIACISVSPFLCY